jgi:hypothetical protein
MRMLLALWMLTISAICDREPSGAPQPQSPPPAVDFATAIRPALEERCSPCHFEGGRMHKRLPFDDARTIVKLGEKLFTRIKDEKTRETIRTFLAQQTSPSSVSR